MQNYKNVLDSEMISEKYWLYWNSEYSYKWHQTWIGLATLRTWETKRSKSYLHITLFVNQRKWPHKRNQNWVFFFYEDQWPVPCISTCSGSLHSIFMSFCRILSTLCSQVVFHNLPHFGKRAGQKVQLKIAVVVQNVKPLYLLSRSFALSPQKSAELFFMFL